MPRKSSKLGYGRAVEWIVLTRAGFRTDVTSPKVLRVPVMPCAAESPGARAVLFIADAEERIERRARRRIYASTCRWSCCRYRQVRSRACRPRMPTWRSSASVPARRRTKERTRERNRRRMKLRIGGRDWCPASSGCRRRRRSQVSGDTSADLDPRRSAGGECIRRQVRLLPGCVQVPLAASTELQ